MYKVLVKRQDGSVFVYEHSIANREEAEYAMSEAALSFDNKHKIYIEHESESEFCDNIQES
jgi:hypothetical protein